MKSNGTISITVENHFKALRELNAFLQSLEAKVNLLLERLMAEGYSIATDAFQTALYAGTNDVVVQEPYWEDNKLVLCAEGNAVAYIEFGTGVHYSEQYPTKYGDPYNKLHMDKRGTHGKKKGRFDAWEYYGEVGTEGRVVGERNGAPLIRTHGNPPARAMFQATENMTDRDYIRQIAKEIFGK